MLVDHHKASISTSTESCPRLSSVCSVLACLKSLQLFTLGPEFAGLLLMNLITYESHYSTGVVHIGGNAYIVMMPWATSFECQSLSRSKTGIALEIMDTRMSWWLIAWLLTIQLDRDRCSDSLEAGRVGIEKEMWMFETETARPKIEGEKFVRTVCTMHAWMALKWNTGGTYLVLFCFGLVFWCFFL